MDYFNDKENYCNGGLETVDLINNQFEEYQRRIVNEEKRLKFFTKVEVSDDFYNLIDDLCGTNLSKINY